MTQKMGHLETLISENIYPFVAELLMNGKIGICAGNVRIIDIQTGCYALQKAPCADRFKIIIPYAGHSVTWEIMFFGNSPSFPPDFLFDDKTFEPDLEVIESLNNWKSDDPKSLLRVVHELMDSYRKHQVSLIDRFARLQFEYSSLVQQNGISENDVEVQVFRKSRTNPINFLIKLPVDLSRIPAILCRDNPSEDSAVLLVTFQSPEGSKVNSQLFLSPGVDESVFQPVSWIIPCQVLQLSRLTVSDCLQIWYGGSLTYQTAFGGTSSLRIPPLVPTEGCLMDYVPNICQLLKNKVDLIVNGFEKRKEYLSAFLCQFESAVLEYDSVFYNKLSFLLEWKDFHFILHIEIPKLFPQDNPTFIFQSIYHMHQDKPFMSKHQDYPYSPRWSGLEMAERARSYILEYVPTFQKDSVRTFK